MTSAVFTQTPTRQPGRVPAPYRVAVVGGGIAGLSAATVLAERGVNTTIYEAENYLGGRAGSWPQRTRHGQTVAMERGFHAFFRQYYNLRAVLARVDPNLTALVPLDDYPICGPNGEVQSFSGLPHRPPFNVIALTRRTQTLTLRDLMKVGARSALEMLAFDPERSYRIFDSMTADEYLTSLRFPPQARQMLFSVFSHSFFNPENAMSAAELLMMFHFYFLGNREGLIFDVCQRPMSTAFWQPLGQRVESHHGTVDLGVTVDRIEPTNGGWTIHVGHREQSFDAVVLALSVPGIKQLVARSPKLGSPAWRSQIDSLDVTHPFAVWRCWLDRHAAPSRPAFVGTTGVGILDNISLYERFQDPSRAWSQAHKGSVIELHAYAVDPALADDEIRDQLWRGCHAIYPELGDAKIVDDFFLRRQDCPSFAPNSYAKRPPVNALPTLALAGDFVRLPMPTALMERAATSGIAAANHVLAQHGVAAEPLHSIASRGLFAVPSLRRHRGTRVATRSPL